MIDLHPLQLPKTRVDVALSEGSAFFSLFALVRVDYRIRHSREWRTRCSLALISSFCRFDCMLLPVRKVILFLHGNIFAKDSSVSQAIVLHAIQRFAHTNKLGFFLLTLLLWTSTPPGKGTAQQKLREVLRFCPKCRKLRGHGSVSVIEFQ